jgi:hypothetical protein
VTSGPVAASVCWRTLSCCCCCWVSQCRRRRFLQGSGGDVTAAVIMPTYLHRTGPRQAAAVLRENFEPEVEVCCARSPTVLRMRVYICSSRGCISAAPTQGSMSKLLLLLRIAAVGVLDMANRFKEDAARPVFVFIPFDRRQRRSISVAGAELASVSACEWRRKHFPPLSQQRQTLLITLR